MNELKDKKVQTLLSTLIWKQLFSMTFHDSSEYNFTWIIYHFHTIETTNVHVSAGHLAADYLVPNGTGCVSLFKGIGCTHQCTRCYWYIWQQPRLNIYGSYNKRQHFLYCTSRSLKRDTWNEEVQKELYSCKNETGGKDKKSGLTQIITEDQCEPGA